MFCCMGGDRGSGYVFKTGESLKDMMDKFLHFLFPTNLRHRGIQPQILSSVLSVYLSPDISYSSVTQTKKTIEEHINEPNCCTG